MKLDPKQLRAEADAHAERMASPLWTAPEGEPDKSWIASLTGIAPTSARKPRPRPDTHAAGLDASLLESPSSADAVEQAVQRVAETTSGPPWGADIVPMWLEAAAGNPHTYDAPDATRRAVCVRILPGTYERLRLVQRQARLRTLAGAWEFLMRLGLAVAERFPSRM